MGVNKIENKQKGNGRNVNIQINGNNKYFYVLARLIFFWENEIWFLLLLNVLFFSFNFCLGIRLSRQLSVDETSSFLGIIFALNFISNAQLR